MHWIDPDYLPKSKGIVDRFLINPQGDIDGILLAGDMEVHVPPHLSGEIRPRCSLAQPSRSTACGPAMPG